MSLFYSLAITLVRSVLLVSLALPMCFWLQSFLRANPRFRLLAWLLLVGPVIAPRMLTGFGYANFSLSLVPFPVWNELLYASLLLITIVPVGTVMCYFAPPSPISEEARHCMNLVRSQRRMGSATVALSKAAVGIRSPSVVAAGLMFVLAFQEFELASLMGVASWTVWLFDAQAGGLILSESLRYITVPLLFELFVLAAVGSVVWKNAGLVATPHQSPRRLSSAGRRAAWIYLWLSVVVFCCVPWSFILRTAWSGLGELTNNFTIAGDIMAGCLFAFLAAALTYGLAGQFVIGSTKRHSRVIRTFLSFVGIPGLFGSLVLGLCVLFVFQSSPLHVLYGTPVPWLSALILLLLPRAILVLLLLTVIRSPEAGHLAKLLAKSRDPAQVAQSRELRWRGSGALHFVTFVLLFFWAYSDLTTASILAPPGLVSAPVRLYNLMHYGQSAVLSAMVGATFGIPVLVFAGVLAFRRPLQKVLMP